MEAAIRIKAEDNRDLLDSIGVALVQIQQALKRRTPRRRETVGRGRSGTVGTL